MNYREWLQQQHNAHLQTITELELGRPPAPIKIEFTELSDYFRDLIQNGKWVPFTERAPDDGKLVLLWGPKNKTWRVPGEPIFDEGVFTVRRINGDVRHLVEGDGFRYWRYVSAPEVTS